MPLGDLYNRDFKLNVGGIPIPMQFGDPLIPDNIDTQLRVIFDVEKNSNKDPNTATVTVFNFNLINRGIIEKGNDIAQEFRGLEPPIAYDWPITIEAGYINNIEQIFSGNITFATSKKEGVDWVTTFECGDGENTYRQARMNKSFSAGTPVSVVALEAAALLGIGPGNIAEKLGPGVFRKGFTVFSQGFVASDSAAQVLDDVLSSAGFNWSIQDGNLLILAPDEASFEEVVILSKEFGMIGAPEKSESGNITVNSLLQGALKPGRRLLVKSDVVTGFFIIERVTHSGDTFGNDWFSTVEAKPGGLV